MTKRSFAGYLCEESESVGLFGECFRARNRSGAHARVIVVDQRLSQRKSFASALARYGSKLGELVHPQIVTTEKVGRGKDGVLVAITSALDEPIDLLTLVDSMGTLPKEVALSIATGAIRGLSYAHQSGVTHGGVHPRSVFIERKGVSKLGDFGLARALASAAAGADDSELLTGLRGYVAPELALGQEPDAGSDVYAAGALVSWLLWSQQEPPEGEQSSLARTLRKAVSTDRDLRFANAGELESELRNAIATSGFDVATIGRVGSYLLERSETVAAGLDAETEDLLASLDVGAPSQSKPQRPASTGALDKALAGLSDESLGLDFDEHTDNVDSNEITVAEYPPGEGGESEYEDEHTTVDAQENRPSVDHVEALIRENAEVPDLPMSIPERTRSRLEAPDDYERTDETPLPAPRPFHEDGTHVAALVDIVGHQAATSSPFDDDDSLPQEPKKRSNTLRWLALIAFVMAALGTVAYTKSDLLSSAQRDSDEENAEALQKIEDMQPKPGQVSILSETEDAAVWLLLGRTPAQSFPLPSGMVHELRIEHEGYQPLFISVAAQHWGGEESARKAVVSASLQPAGENEETLPAFPPVADPPLTPGGPGQGVVAVESQPAGAQVWMLVGTTPVASLTGIQGGKDYEFKVLKDGHRPAFAAFKAEDWYLSGKEGPMRPTLSAELELEPLPEGDLQPIQEEDEKDSAKHRRGRKNRK